MGMREVFCRDAEDSMAVVNACYTITDQYRMILHDLGGKHQLSDNEMLVLVHIANHPVACTQKKLQETNLHLSGSSICRMVESLRRKGYLTTKMYERDRRSWIIHLEPSGEALAEEFVLNLGKRLDDIFLEIPNFDPDAFVALLSQASSTARQMPYQPGIQGQ